MKLVYVFMLFGLMGCGGGNTCEAPAKTTVKVTDFVHKFRDGDVVCYKYWDMTDFAMSCVVLPELKHE